MIYFIYGEHKDAARTKAHELLKVLKTKRPDAELFEMQAGTWNGDEFTSFLTSQGLFEKKLIVTLKDVCTESEEATEYVVDRMKEIAESENVFVFVESKLKTDVLGKFKKAAQKTIEVKDSGAEAVAKKGAFGASRAGADFNVFALGEAFGARNRGLAWSLYEKALMRGSEPEELHGLIFWQLKTMLVASTTSSAEEAGLKPFVYSKAKRLTQNYSPEEMRTLSQKMVALYHESRMGGVGLEMSLEKFLLGI